jgi:hypothetical protein
MSGRLALPGRARMGRLLSNLRPGQWEDTNKGGAENEGKRAFLARQSSLLGQH